MKRKKRGLVLQLLLCIVIAGANFDCGSSSGISTPPPPAISVAVTPVSATVQATTTQAFTASVQNDTAVKGVTWTLTQNGTTCSPACGTLSATSTPSGTSTVYSAPATIPSNSTVMLTALSVTDPTKSAVASITVSAAPLSISFTGSTDVNLVAGGTAQFAVIVNNDPTNQGVTWSVFCLATDCGSVSPTSTKSGIPITYTAPSTPPVNTLLVQVAATSVAEPSQVEAAIVNVQAITLSVSPNSVWLPAGLNLSFTATIANDPANAGVIWSLTQNGSACQSSSCGTLSSSTATPVTYTAPATVAADSTVILTATSVTDSTKSAPVTITLTRGPVELVPDSLSFGSVLVNTTSSPQSVTLTNTGTTALSISGITITGTNAGEFSQTNTCNSSVNSGSSCTITATFTPSARGLLTASISITDSSTDSPQTVSLSGTGYTRGAAKTASVRSALAGMQTVTTPLPTGHEIAGTRVLHVIDSARTDPFLHDRSKRELMIRFWYPAALVDLCKRADYTPASVWNYFSQLAGVHLPEVITNSCADAPMTDGLHPVVIFTHGYTGTYTDYTFLFEDLASRGYVVASVDHTYEATAVEFPGGRFVKSKLGSHLANTWRGDEATLTFATSVRVEDLKFVRSELERLNGKADSPFRGSLDLSRVAVAGHSMGGAAALLTLQRDDRFKVAVNLDGFLPEGWMHSTQKPVLLLSAGQPTLDQCSMWNKLRGPRELVNLLGSEHLTPSDAVWLARGAIETGRAGPEKTIAAIRGYVEAFLDTHLRERTPDSPLTGLSSTYSDVSVTTGDQACSRP